MLILIRPMTAFLESYRKACEETYGYVHNSYILHDPSKFQDWSKTIFQQYQNEENGIGLPEGYVPSVTLWAVDTDTNEYVGTVNIRLALTEQLRDYGGQAGFMIRRSFRGRGYARILLRLLIKEAGKREIDPLLLTCIDSNLASMRTLQHFVAEKIETAETYADGVFCPIHRFYFRTDKIIPEIE